MSAIAADFKISVRVAAIGLAVSAWAMLNTPWTRVLEAGTEALNHTACIASGADALREGQAVAREAPRGMLHTPPVFDRYPVFQFYSVLPYELGGFLVLAGVLPYHAMVGMVFFFYFFGFVGAYRLGRRTGISQGASMAAAVIFTLAPYHLYDWGMRCAFAELAAFALLPWALETSLGALNQKSLGLWLGCAVAWCALMLCHNIFHAWSVALFFPLLLWGRPRDGQGAVFWRPVTAYLFALALAAFFLAPVALAGPYFSGLDISPMRTAYLTKLGHLLNHPWMFPLTGYAGATDDFMQIGWPVLAGAVAYVILAGKAAFKNPVLWLFSLTVFLAWSPFDFWGYLGPLKVIQFPYRLLAYAGLFGAMLAGKAWDLARFRSQPVSGLALFAACALLALPYLGLVKSGPFSPADLAAVHQEMGQLMFLEPNVYVISDENAWKFGPPLPLQGLEQKGRYRDLGQGVEVYFEDKAPALAGLKPGPWTQARFAQAGQDTVALLPAAWYPGMYRMEVNGQPAAYGRVGNRLALRLPSGDSVVRFRFAGLAWANGLSLLAWLAWLALAAAWVRRGLFKVEGLA